MYYVPVMMSNIDYNMCPTGAQQYQDYSASIAAQQKILRELTEAQERISLDIQEKRRILEQLEER